MTPDRRTLLIGGALAAGPASAFAQTAPSTGQLVRCALFVSNLETSTVFYRDLVGLPELLFEGSLEGAPLERLLGLAAGAGVRFRILKAEGPPYGMIALFQVTGQTLTTVRKTQGAVNIGEGGPGFPPTRPRRPVRAAGGLRPPIPERPRTTDRHAAAAHRPGSDATRPGWRSDQHHRTGLKRVSPLFAGRRGSRSLRSS